MSELPRVLLCAFEVVPSPTSVSRRVMEYLRAFAGRFNVDVLTLKSAELPDVEKVLGARLLRVPVGTGPLPARAEAFERALRRQLEREPYGLVHFSDPYAGHPLVELRTALGYRLVYEALAFPSQELRFTSPELGSDHRFLARVRRHELSCLMNADVVIAGSAAGARALRSLGVPDDRLRILRTPAEAVVRPPAPPSSPGLRVVYAGSQLPWQGLTTALRAFAHVVTQTPARLRLIGPPHPAFEPPLRKLVADLRLDPAVEWVAPVPGDSLPRLLTESDVALLPVEDVERHRTSAAPLTKIADYLAAGLPIVASDLPLTRELVPEAAARFFRAGDALALAEQLVALVADPAERARRARAASAEARSTFDPRRFHAVALDLYEEQLGAPARVDGETEVAEEISSDEILEAADEHPAAAPPATSRGDPWLTQVLHGYCPPEGVQFGRPTPPAQFVGREMSPAGGVPALPPSSRSGRPDGTKP